MHGSGFIHSPGLRPDAEVKGGDPGPSNPSAFQNLQGNQFDAPTEAKPLRGRGAFPGFTDPAALPLAASRGLAPSPSKRPLLAAPHRNARLRPGKDPRIVSILGQIEANLHRSLKASEFARWTNLSLFRFLHVFKDEVGESFGQYCNRLRLERARALLHSGARDLETIAQLVGLPSSKALAYHFKRRFQLPPSRYRRESAAPAAPPDPGPGPLRR